MADVEFFGPMVEDVFVLLLYRSFQNGGAQCYCVLEKVFCLRLKKFTDYNLFLLLIENTSFVDIKVFLIQFNEVLKQKLEMCPCDVVFSCSTVL